MWILNISIDDGTLFFSQVWCMQGSGTKSRHLKCMTLHVMESRQQHMEVDFAACCKLESLTYQQSRSCGCSIVGRARLLEGAPEARMGPHAEFTSCPHLWWSIGQAGMKLHIQNRIDKLHWWMIESSWGGNCLNTGKPCWKFQALTLASLGTFCNTVSCLWIQI